MANRSRKHHYIPEFYLKCFTADDGKLAVYDVQKQQFVSKRKYPSEVCYEYDRNTFEINGNKDDIIEKIHGNYESKFGDTFRKIKEQVGESVLDAKDTFCMALFMGMLYWRIPATDSLIEEEVRKISFDQRTREVIDKLTGGHATEYYIDLLSGQPETIALHRIIKPIIDYDQGFDYTKTDNWQVYHKFFNERKEFVNFHLVGDNPIIFKEDTFTNLFGTECIMNVSNGKTLYHRLAPQPASKDSLGKLYIDCLIFLQSERYVCGPNIEYLEFIADAAFKFKSVSPLAYAKLFERLNIKKSQPISHIDFMKAMAFDDITDYMRIISSYMKTQTPGF